MSSFPGSPRLIKAGIALLDPENGAVQRLIALQYNPDTLTRTLAPKSPGETADRSEALRLKGPPVETIKLEAEIDAADLLEVGDANALESGIASHLAALETIEAMAASTPELPYAVEYLRGVCLLAAKRRAEAQTAFQTAMARCPQQLYRAVLRPLAEDVEVALLGARPTADDWPPRYSSWTDEATAA